MNSVSIEVVRATIIIDSTEAKNTITQQANDVRKQPKKYPDVSELMSAWRDY